MKEKMREKSDQKNQNFKVLYVTKKTSFKSIIKVRHMNF